MMRYVHRPVSKLILYQTEEPDDLALRISHYLNSLDLDQDPHIKRLRKRKDLKSQTLLESFLQGKKKTHCHKQLRACLLRTLGIREALGPWAADTFLFDCRRRLQESCERWKQQPRDDSQDWNYEDDRYMLEILSQVAIPQERQTWESVPDEVSGKANLLINLLETEISQYTRAIIFAKERATVVMLNHVISMHPKLKHVRSGVFLGCASYAARKADLIELTGPKDQADAVKDLRLGKKNILVSTSVLEEGVDIPACDLVICFEPPNNLRSFIQRRGRARMKRSQFVLFYEKTAKSAIDQWTKMEQTMKEMYEDDMREREAALERESIEEAGYEGLRISSTGYVLPFPLK
jgi:hypothetical protein